MLTIGNDVQKIEVFLRGFDAQLQDYRRLWTDFVAPFTYQEVEDIFDSEGYGRWSPLSPVYAARKAKAYPGKGILRREDAYFKAATTPSHSNSFADVGATELVLGVRGLEYPAFHEEGAGDLRARPVYALIPQGERFEERLRQLGEKWVSEEIAKGEKR